MLLYACQPRLVVEDAAQIECAGDRDCPEGFGCRVSVNRCVPLGASTDVPRLESFAFSPPAGGRGTTFTLRFATSEPLLVEPSAIIGAAPGYAMRLQDDSRPEELAWSFAYEADGDEAEATHPVRVSLVNRAGIEAPDLAAGIVTFDFAAPADPLVSVEEGAVVALAAVTLRLSATGATEMLVDGDVMDGRGVREWIAYAGSLPVVLAGDTGPKALRARFRDSAGKRPAHPGRRSGQRQRAGPHHQRQPAAPRR